MIAAFLLKWGGVGAVANALFKSASQGNQTAAILKIFKLEQNVKLTKELVKSNLNNITEEQEKEAWLHASHGSDGRATTTSTSQRWR